MLNLNHEAVQQIIREVAATVIMPRFKRLKPEEVAYKIAYNPVTIADKEAESALSTRLTDLLPGSKAMGEEAFFTNPGLLDLISGTDPVWIIDPIDGTQNFVDGTPRFAVIVALAERNQTIASWIYDPISNEFLSAEKGAGAFHKGRPVKTLEGDYLDKMVGTGFEISQAFDEANKSGRKLILSGPKLEPTLWSIAHENARLVVASPAFSSRGPQWHFHALLTYLTPWDNAAGALIHAEAGGYGAHWNGDAYTPSAYGRGILLAPDQQSWHAIRRWVESFTTLPE